MKAQTCLGARSTAFSRRCTAAAVQGGPCERGLADRGCKEAVLYSGESALRSQRLCNVSLVMIQRWCVPSKTLNCSHGSIGHKQERYDEMLNKWKSMLIKIGWISDFREKNTPVLPKSGWMEDNLKKKSENMACWKRHVSLCGMLRNSMLTPGMTY